MKQLPSVELVRAALSYDPKTGVFRWRQRADRSRKWNSRYAGTVAGSLNPAGYCIIMLEKGQNYAAHRLAWLCYHGECPDGPIDHINGTRHDNKITNLREATHAQNGFNRDIPRNNTSGFPGVSYNNQRGKWEARIFVARKAVWRKFFSTPEEAHEARLAELANHHGEFANLEPAPRRYLHSRHRYGERALS